MMSLLNHCHGEAKRRAKLNNSKEHKANEKLDNNKDFSGNSI